LKIAVIGVGLIGGSVALAARERAGADVVGYDPAGVPEHVAAPAASLEQAVTGADITIAAAPVAALPDVVAAALAASDGVVTDVGSTKRSVVAGADDPRFIGGHPLAGAETAGVEHARADLFDGATWYLTPTARTEGLLYDRLYRFLTGIGARPQALDPATHDTLMATVSHLPHVLANVLVAQAARALDAEGERLPATGPSFRDATRVAGAPTAIWRDIYLSNADALGAVLEDTLARLEQLRAALAAGDGEAIATWNDHAAGERRKLLDAHLTGSDVAGLRVSVPNRPGVVAEVALALGRESVNIVDMALHPAADNATGTIELWVAAEQADAARRLIDDLGLPVA
jgi:prephenate dehydrogenase